MQNEKIDPTKPIVLSQGVSTGPRSIAGKEISSRNAMRHGCCSTETLILKDRENIEDYKALEATWFKAYSPKDEAETHLVQELVNSDWFLQRATRTVAEVEAQLFEAAPNPLNWDDQQNRAMARFLRYQTTRANTVTRCRKAIEDFRKSRATEKLAEAKVSTAQTKLKAVQEKNKPEPTWKEHLEGMRQKAIALGYTPPDLTKR